MVKNGNLAEGKQRERGKVIWGEGEWEMGAISTTNRLGILTCVLFSSMCLRSAI